MGEPSLDAVRRRTERALEIGRMPTGAYAHPCIVDDCMLVTSDWMDDGSDLGSPLYKGTPLNANA